MASLLGYERDRMVGATALTIVAPEQRERIRDRRASLYRGESIGFNRATWVRSDGSLVSVEVSATLVQYEGTESVLVIGRDQVDVERQGAEQGLRQSETMFRDLYDAAPDAIVLVGDDGIVLLANAEAHRAFGYEAGTLVGSTLEELLPAALRAAHARHREGYFVASRTRRMGERLDLVGQRRDGSEFPVDISLGPFSY